MDKPIEHKVYEFDDFWLDAGSLMLYHLGREVSLVPKAVEVLLVLVENQGKIISKNELIEAVWPDTVVEESNLSLYLHILRKTLGDRKDGKPYLETFRRRGYRFNGDVRHVQNSADSHYAWVVDNPTQDARNTATQSGRFHILKDRNGDQSESGDEKAEPLASLIDTSGTNSSDTNTSENEIKLNKRYVFSLSLGVILLAAIAAGSFYWRSRQEAADNADAPKSLAILPFKPLVADNRDEFLEIGMADALISSLSERREIEVRPLSSVRAFVRAGKDPVAIGQALATDAVLDGGVQRSGDNIHINARLIKVADGSSLWTETFDGNYQELLGERGLIDRLTAVVALRLAGSAGTAPFTHHTENVEAWEYYLRGSYQAGHLTPPKIQESIDYYQKAIDRDPNYALAYAGLSRAYIALAPSSDYPPTEVFPRAKDAALKAIEIDERLAEGHAVLCSIRFWYEWDWSGAEDQCRQAVQLNGNSAEAHYTYAHLLSNIGRHSEALAEMKRARALDPVNLRVNALEGQFLLHAGQTDEALEKLRKTVELLPELWLGHLFISSIYIEKGMYAEAVSEADLASKYSGASNHPAAFKGYALAKAGKNEARKVLDELSGHAKERFVPPYYFALVYNGLGDTDKAVGWLERGLEQRDCKMVFLKVEPKWNNLRSNPRFVQLIKKMRFD